jgi:RimJ/RimL family protein N-acetyltransferase
MIQLLPYSMVDGSWSIPDEGMIDAFFKASEQESIKSIFWDGKVKTAEDFINYFKSPRNLPVFVFKDNKACGFAWINNVSMGHASSHFCVFREFWGSKHKKEIFESVMDYWFGFKGENGFLFDTLIGMIPKFNTHAIKYVEDNGFKLVGEIPNMVNDIFNHRKSSIVILYRSR